MIRKSLTYITGTMLVAVFAFAGVSVSHAQTASTTGGTSGTIGTTGTVGAPNTGAGGNAPLNLAILLSSGLVAAGGGLYLSRKSDREHAR